MQQKISFFFIDMIFSLFLYHVILLSIQIFNDNFIMSLTNFTKVTIDLFSLQHISIRSDNRYNNIVSNVY
jgi:hypothetical protein